MKKPAFIVEIQIRTGFPLPHNIRIDIVRSMSGPGIELMQNMACWALRQWRSRHSGSSFRWHLDYPIQKNLLYDDLRGISGWISGPTPIAAVVLRSDTVVDSQVKLKFRPDVQNSQRSWFRYSTGFESSRPIRDWLAPSGRARITLEIRWTSGKTDSVTLDLANAYELKIQKRERFQSVLVCPECHGPLIATDGGWNCPTCRLSYSATPYSINFLTPDMAREFNIIPTSNVSYWGYDSHIDQIIRNNPDKLYLDCGAGLRSTYHDNVINFEIVDYYSTDVLGVNEKLPFADNSLDGVFSVAVLEHVQDPFRCAGEILRVLKPGGVLFCAVPFLQPVHGFPHHYYNMTRQGLLNLWKDRVRIEQVLVPMALHPIHGLQWMLRLYAEGLPAQQREDFKRMRIQDLLDVKIIEEWESGRHAFIHALPESAQVDIASGNVIIATKK